MVFTLSDRIAAFIKLGQQLASLTEEEQSALFYQAQQQNSWFTFSSLAQALKGLQVMLLEEDLNRWIATYAVKEPARPKEIGIMMAGNIPAVGFHDLLCVLLTGHTACVKLSSLDRVLMQWLIKQLIALEPRFAQRVVVEEMLKQKEAYIATGSDNSARYFTYYFGKYPHLIRSNRTSVAILSKNTSDEDLQKLGEDVFSYFGLGCRNVSKVFCSKESQLHRLLEIFSRFQEVASHHKYFNNYEYNKSIFLVNGTPHLDNGFLLLHQSKELVSPIGVLHYELFKEEEKLKEELKRLDSKIQCTVADASLSLPGVVPFGKSQFPKVWEYADRVDTIAFLLGLEKK